VDEFQLRQDIGRYLEIDEHEPWPSFGYMDRSLFDLVWFVARPKIDQNLLSYQEKLNAIHKSLIRAKEVV